MLLIVSKTFRAIGAHANDNERRDQSCLAIEPHPHHSTIKDESHDRFIGGWAGIPGVPVGADLAPYRAHAPPNKGRSARRMRRALFAAR